MGNWTGVVTNAGSELLNEWVSGKTLRFTAAEAGDRTVPEAALLAQTAVSGALEGSGVSLTGYSRVPGGVQLRIQIAAPEESYTLRQLGVWAALDGGAAVLLALYQNPEGVPIQSRADYPDFSYTFYGAVALDNTGKFEVHVDTSALATAGDLLALKEEILKIVREELASAAAAHNMDEHAHPNITALTVDENSWVEDDPPEPPAPMA